MTVKIDNEFDTIAGDDKSSVILIEPDVHDDNRGSFAEVLKDYGSWNENCGYPLWLSDMKWVRQINRSKSTTGVIRGLHAQSGTFCQAKLVEAINRPIYDIIVDMRPDSKTFGTTKIYFLNPVKQNKLFVPRGFLHGFVVTESDSNDPATFMYYCDNVFNKESEICVNPVSVTVAAVKTMADTLHWSDMEFHIFYPLFKMLMGRDIDPNWKMPVFSDKDIAGEDFLEFHKRIAEDYNKNGKLWYR